MLRVKADPAVGVGPAAAGAPEEQVVLPAIRGSKGSTAMTALMEVMVNRVR